MGWAENQGQNSGRWHINVTEDQLIEPLRINFLASKQHVEYEASRDYIYLASKFFQRMWQW